MWLGHRPLWDQSPKQQASTPCKLPSPPTSLVKSLEGFMIFFSFLFTISATPSAGTCSPHAQKPCSNITKKTDKKKKHALVSSQKESIRFNYGAILPWLLSPADSNVARQHSLCQEWRSKEATMWFVLPIFFFLPEVFSRSRIENVIHDDNSVWNDYIFKAVFSKHWFAVDPNIHVHIFTMRPR